MTPAALPLTRDIVLVGGGHAHALVLRAWGKDPLPGARLTVISPGPTAPYTGMLPGFVAGHYSRDALEIDLIRLAHYAKARMILGTVTALDPGAKTLTVPGRGALPYDLVSVDIGIHSDLPQIPGFDRHGVPAKPLGRFAAAWSAHLTRLADDPDLAERGIAVIGAGVGGVELAMAMAHSARVTANRPVPVRVIDSGAALSGVGAGAARALRTAMQDRGVTLSEHVTPTALDATGVSLSDGTHVTAGFCVGAAGAVPYRWLAETGLALHNGFVRVDATLRAVGNRSVFAVGDCAHMDHAPRTKAGVFAVRQAPILTANLRAALGAGVFKRYTPQRDYLKLISLGRKEAVADKFGLRLEGAWLWRWKDHIDQAFMTRLSDLTPMPPPKRPAKVARGVAEALGNGQPLCGGCGSKLGRDALASVLGGSAMEDAAILPWGKTQQVISTDHLRAFIEDPEVMARIACNHALGDVFAMGATPQSALATVILPRASDEIHRRMMAEITAAARSVLDNAGAQLQGGHSLVGDGLSLGFTVTGTTERPILLSGARAGDALILSKPIGTGVIMAAHMALAARGPWVAGALAAMQQSQRDAAALLCDAHAMTDVTGFGLAGHLWGLCEASDLAATLTLADVPTLDGALTLTERGHRSSLFPQNSALAGAMTLPQNDPRADLLFDPQTAGGLLAAVAPDTAPALCRRLCDAGYTAAVIGHLSHGPPHITGR